MPAVSEKQRKMMAIAEHHPEKLYAKNKGVLSMSHKQLHEFAVKKDGGFYGHHKVEQGHSGDLNHEKMMSGHDGSGHYSHVNSPCQTLH